jgi:hypothetical protein
MNLNIELKPSVLKRLKQQAKSNVRTLEAEVQYMIETWLEKDFSSALKIENALGDDLNAALEEGFRQYAAGESELTVRVLGGKPITKSRKKKNERISFCGIRHINLSLLQQASRCCLPPPSGGGRRTQQFQSAGLSRLSSRSEGLQPIVELAKATAKVW